MRITLESDYAIRIISYMAKTEKVTDAKTICEATGVTVRFGLKILHKLVGAGILKPFKGARGGYMLAKAPRDTTVRETLEAIDGEYELARCTPDHNACSHPDGDLCRFRSELLRISQMVRFELDKINFS